MTNRDLFQRAQDEYFRLKGMLAAGRITRPQFESAVKDLMLQDDQGRYWKIDAETATWSVRNGTQWVPAQPPSEQTPKPQRLTASRNFTPVPAPRTMSTRQTNWTPIILISALVGVGAAIVTFFVFASNQPKPGIVRQPTSISGANVTSAPSPVTKATIVTTPSVAAAIQIPTVALASSNIPGVDVSIVSGAPPSSIAAQDFAERNSSLAEKIAVLNQAELKFIRDMRASASNEPLPRVAFPSLQKGSAMTDKDLQELAGKAMDVAILADQLGELSAKQDKGSPQAAQSADAYLAIARNAFALVVDAQTLRQDLLNHLIPGAQGIELIAEYGAQLWNSEVTESGAKGNPFGAIAKKSEPVQALSADAMSQLQSQTNASNASIWMAQSGTQTVKTLSVPASQAPVSNPFDPTLLKSLTTADGQGDGALAQQVAAANLRRLGATTTSSDPTKPTQLQVPTSSVAVSEGFQVQSGNLPTFKSGKATIVSKENSDENSFLQSFGLDGQKPPSDEGKTDVKDAPALVNLSISDVVINNVSKAAPGSTFEANVQVSFTVKWNTSLGAPQFSLTCAGGNERTITQTSGSLRLQSSSLLILYPGTTDVYCYASSGSGTSFGSTSVRVLVGDAAEATVRANQVETDSARLNATLTAEAQGTANAEQTNAAATAQVNATSNAVGTEVAGTETVEFKLTAAAFATKQAQPPPATAEPTFTPTFTPQVVDQLAQAGNVMAVTTHVVLQRGRLYRFTFSGRVNLINPTHSASANDLPEHVNGVVVPASGIVVIEGTGSTATITCGSGEPDPNDPGGFGITVEDLGPL